MDAIIAAFFFAIAAGATYCARLTRADRSYWPMLRIIWSLLVLAYGGSGLALVLGRGRIAPATRLIAAGAVLAAVAYSAAFMRRRNRLPRFQALSVGGEVIVRPIVELEAKADEVESWAAHGAMPPERAARLAAALDRWRAHEAWRRGLAAETQRRRRGTRESGSRRGTP